MNIFLVSLLTIGMLSGCAFTREMTMTVKADKVDHPVVDVKKGDVLYDSCTSYSFLSKPIKVCK